MGKIMLSELTGHGAACSKVASLRSNIEVIPHVVAEHLQSKYCYNLKYVHIQLNFYEHVKASSGKTERFVQNSRLKGID